MPESETELISFPAPHTSNRGNTACEKIESEILVLPDFIRNQLLAKLNADYGAATLATARIVPPVTSFHLNMINNGPIGIVFLNSQGEVIYVNQSAIDVASLAGSLEELLHKIMQVRPQVISAGKRHYVVNILDDFRNGRCIYFTDITSFAHEDAVTGLPNREAFVHKIDSKLQKLELSSGGCFSVMVILIREFHKINTLGSATGDEFLKWMSGILQAYFGNNATIARLNGPKFGLILEEMAGQDYLDKLQLTIHDLFRQPFRPTREKIFPHLNLGVAVVTGTELHNDGQHILEAAMSAAKVAQSRHQSTTRLCVFDGDLREASVQELKIQKLLHDAVVSPESMDNVFEPHYQPIVSLQEGDNESTLGFEFLLRCRHFGRNIAPDIFIPIAEKNPELMRKIGRWVVWQACRTLKDWNQEYSTLFISINISPVQLADPGFSGEVLGLMEKFRICRNNLRFEITESSIELDNAAVMENLRVLNGPFSIDDYGKDNSSPERLMKLMDVIHIATLKIDKNFAIGLDGRAPETVRRKMLMAAMIRFAHELGDLKVVVEGVESFEIAQFLRGAGCDYAQGYYYSRPVRKTDAFRIFTHPEW